MARPFTDGNGTPQAGVLPPVHGVSDPQIDPATGEPVAIVPAGELPKAKDERGSARAHADTLKIAPGSRIPRPPQPDLA
jgi:hypothetical protein